MPLIDSGDDPKDTPKGVMFIAHDDSTLEPVFIEVETWVLGYYGQASDLRGINTDVRRTMLGIASGIYDHEVEKPHHIMLDAETMEIS